MNLELFKIQTQSVKRKTQCQMENARLPGAAAATVRSAPGDI
jgi:hypothetical protein